MADNSSIPVASGNETFANKDIAGVKYPRHIQVDGTGAEIVPATQTTLADVKTAVEALAALIVGGALTTSLDSGSPGIITTGTPGSPDTTNVLSVQGQASMTPIATTIQDISSGEYETVAASQTDQALGATGATGDWLEGLLIVPATAAAGAVSIKDGAGSSVTVFVGGGTTALPTLAPIYVPLGMKSTGGAWKVTTGANVSAIGIGNFT